MGRERKDMGRKAQWLSIGVVLNTLEPALVVIIVAIIRPAVLDGAPGRPARMSAVGAWGADFQAVRGPVYELVSEDSWCGAAARPVLTTVISVIRVEAASFGEDLWLWGRPARISAVQTCLATRIAGRGRVYELVSRELWCGAASRRLLTDKSGLRGVAGNAGEGAWLCGRREGDGVGRRLVDKVARVHVRGFLSAIQLRSHCH